MRVEGRAMFNGAMVWGGHHVCQVLTSVFSDSTVSACEGHEQAVGVIAFLWLGLLLGFWRMFGKTS
jgi:hypothetical protein